MTIAKPYMTEAEFMRLPDAGYKVELVDGKVQEVPGSVRNDEIAAIVIYHSKFRRPLRLRMGMNELPC